MSPFPFKRGSGQSSHNHFPRSQGNYVGHTEAEISALSEEDYERKLKRSYSALVDSGAHYVIDTVNDMPYVIRDINRRLAAGEHP